MVQGTLTSCTEAAATSIANFTKDKPNITTRQLSGQNGRKTGYDIPGS
jgi:hypothetical protein